MIAYRERQEPIGFFNRAADSESLQAISESAVDTSEKRTHPHLGRVLFHVMIRNTVAPFPAQPEQNVP